MLRTVIRTVAALVLALGAHGVGAAIAIDGQCVNGGGEGIPCDTAPPPVVYVPPPVVYVPPPEDPAIGQARDENLQGINALNAGDIEKAIAFFTQALKTNPTDEYRRNLNAAYVKLHFLKGRDAFRVRNWDLAIKEFQNVLVFLPNDPSALHNIKVARANASRDLAHAAWREKRYDDAMAHYKAAQAESPTPETAALLVRVEAAKFEHLAIEAFKARKYDEAIRHYEAVLKLNPGDETAKTWLDKARLYAAGERNRVSKVKGIQSEALGQAADATAGDAAKSPNPFDGNKKQPQTGVAWKPTWVATPQESKDMQAAHARYDQAEAKIAEIEAKLGKTSDILERNQLKKAKRDEIQAKAEAYKAYETAASAAGIALYR